MGTSEEIPREGTTSSVLLQILGRGRCVGILFRQQDRNKDLIKDPCTKVCGNKYTVFIKIQIFIVGPPFLFESLLAWLAGLGRQRFLFDTLQLIGPRLGATRYQINNR